MQMPINIPDVLNIAMDMQKVKDTRLSVSLVIDSTAPAELSAHVRAAFASEAPNTRVRINNIDDAGVFEAERAEDDIAVVVAGTNPLIGKLVCACHDKGVPTMVITDDGAEVTRLADESGYPIPAGDIVMPVKLESQIEANVVGRIPALSRLLKKGAKADDASPKEDAPSDGLAIKGADTDGATFADGSVTEIGSDALTGKIAINDETLSILDARIGKWIITVCKEKDLAFAYSFPFIRRPLAMDSIMMTSLQNGAIGLVPFLPGADMPVMTLNQVKMTLQIATAYGQPVDKDRVKEIVAVVGGAFVCRHVARSVIKVIPGIGPAASATMGYFGTQAMGRAMLEYFEAGGDIVGAANVLQTARDAAKVASKDFADSEAGKFLIDRLRSVDFSRFISK